LSGWSTAHAMATVARTQTAAMAISRFTADSG
jgi:hypothetical protein